MASTQGDSGASPSSSRDAAQPVWHALSLDDALRVVDSRLGGLTSAEAAKRLRRDGPNVLARADRRSTFQLFLAQYRDFMILVLIAAALVAALLGETNEAIAIVAIVLLNGLLSFTQEYRAERALKALEQMAAPNASVRRDGRATSIPVADIVRGDVVLLEAGSIVPADLRLSETVWLRIDESTLTGESQPVEKDVAACTEASTVLGDRRDLAYQGTVVAAGRGAGVVFATGMATELGRIAGLLSRTIEVKTPLERKLASFGRRLALIVLAICAGLFLLGLGRGDELLPTFMTAVSLAVAAIPEALPAVVTITLAIGAHRMAGVHALIRKLSAVEALGSVTTICSDKTGTLTANRMQVDELHCDGETRREPGGRSTWTVLLRGLALNNDCERSADGSVTGDPTEIALDDAARRAGFAREDVEREFSRLVELPFDSERKSMTTLHRDPAGGFVSFTKGASEVVLGRATRILTESGPVPLARAEAASIAERMAAGGLRVLALATRSWSEMPSASTPEILERDLTLVGLVGLLDPPRAEARDAVEMCRSAGITPIMITGDHPLTARAIASRIGFPSEKDALVLGADLAALGEDGMRERVRSARVYARVAPEQKLAIVRALQDEGEVIAMTGDGVNDAPALKQADIGVAMGITGTDVAKEASAMIVLDDNFASIVDAVREGRTIYDNIRRFIRYMLTTNAGEIWTVAAAPLLGLPVPLLPAQILFVNLVTDGLPAIALAMEPPEADVMRRPPRPPHEGILARGLGLQVLWVGLLIGILSLGTQAIALGAERERWQTVVFAVLCLCQLWNVLAVRSESQSLLAIGMLSNKPLVAALAATLLMLLAVLYVPALNRLFQTRPLSASELCFAILVSSTVFLAVEVEKWIRRRQLPAGAGMS